MVCGYMSEMSAYLSRPVRLLLLLTRYVDSQFTIASKAMIISSCAETVSWSDSLSTD